MSNCEIGLQPIPRRGWVLARIGEEKHNDFPVSRGFATGGRHAKGMHIQHIKEERR